MKSASGESNFLYPYYPNASCVFIVHWQIKMGNSSGFHTWSTRVAQLLIITTSRVSGIDDLKRKHAIFQDFQKLMNRTQDRNSSLGRSLRLKRLEMATKVTCKDDTSLATSKVNLDTCGNHHIPPFPVVTLGPKCDCLRWRIIHQDQWHTLG